MSCHAILKNLYEPKMDVILTIRFKITAEIEITKHMFCVRRCRNVYRRFEKHNYVLSFIHCHRICVYIVFLLLIARLMRLAIILPAKCLWCSGQVQFRRADGAGFESYRILFFLLSFFFPFFVLLFSINIQLNNCYLIKCNKQREKYCVPYIKYMDKQSEFLLFPTIYCGKTRVDDHLIIF